MAGGDGQSDCQGRGPLDVGRVVLVRCRREDDEDEDEGDEELDPEGLANADLGVDGRHAETLVALDLLRGHGLPDENAKKDTFWMPKSNLC